MASAVSKYDPNVDMAIGPVIDDGFYYDFEFSLTPPKESDLKNITKDMRSIINKGFEVKQWTETKDEARRRFEYQPYKLELIDDIEEDEVGIYQVGDFIDLCRGPHVESSTELPADAFKLTSIAGAYWKGDENNKMLTRIYAIAFETKEDLQAHEKMLEEAEKRDHRKLGKELDLFSFSELVGPGLPLFTPRGTLIRDLIVDKIMTIQQKFGYEKVTIPHITKQDLYETSGHWDKFADDLFKVTGKNDAQFVMKPMNCPHHTQIYARRPHSYKELPIRYAEATMVYRDEQQGELLGLARVRSITQDDGHVFCTLEQVEQEVENIVHVIREFYTSLDMYEDGKFWVSLSVRDPKTPEKYLGTDEKWSLAEDALEAIAKKHDLPYKRVEGEAAFYGPKLDFMFFDAIGRERQLATAQIDFVMPERFELEYTDSDGHKKQPVMIHRAIAGSLERFMAIMIEHFAGAFPLWLSPTQVHIIPIAEPHKEFAGEVASALEQAGIRIHYDDSNESMGKKIRAAKVAKVPYFLVIGDAEVEAKSVKAEARDGSNETLSIDALVQKLQDEIQGKKT